MKKGGVMEISVKNEIGTKDEKCKKCGKEWIEHWELNMSRNCGQCRNPFCENKENNDMVGAHVVTVPSNGISYILPLCRSCNSKKESLGIFIVDSNDLCKADECIKENIK
jgi:hypothetical protein